MTLGLGVRLAALLLLFACLSPLATVYGGLPDVSGAEAGLALGAWLLAVLSSGRLHAIDAVVVLLPAWAALSAAANDVPVMAAVLYSALLTAPFTTLRLIMHSDPAGLRFLRRVLVFLVIAQVAMFGMQLVTYAGIDDLKGTFTGTHYGAHIASFLVLVGAAMYALSRPGSRAGWSAVVAAMVFAYLADSKIALMYFLIAGIGYVLVGKTRGRTRAGSGPARLLLGVVGAGVVWTVYTGALGNIPIAGYVEQSTTTGGGKIIVTELIVDPSDRFWAQENYLLGAGPAQTVSRTAGLTVPNPTNPVPPASGLGIPQSEYHAAFEYEAAGYGYLSSSSVTKAASSLLGILGDIGLVGLGIYAWGYVLVYRWLGRRLGHRSWPAVAWLVLLIPGFLGEWLEFPPAGIFLVCVSGWLCLRADDRAVGVGGGGTAPHLATQPVLPVPASLT